MQHKYENKTQCRILNYELYFGGGQEVTQDFCDNYFVFLNCIILIWGNVLGDIVFTLKSKPSIWIEETFLQV